MNRAMLNGSVEHCSSGANTVADEREKALRKLLGCLVIEKREFCVEKKKFVKRERKRYYLDTKVSK